MTTIILTTIGIILAAAAALMIMFYGGDRFNSDTARAEAQTLMNAGANVRSASNVYYASKGRLPADPTILVSSKGLTSMPQVSGIGSASTQWRDYGETGGRPKKAYVVSGVDDNVCRYVNKSLISADREQILSKPEGVAGCYSENGSNVYYMMLNDAAPENVTLGSCDNPTAGTTDVALDSQVCYLKQAMVQAANLSQGITQDRTVLSDLHPQLAMGPVSYVLVRPNGGTFGNGRHLVFYLNEGTWEFSPFCRRWNATNRPTGSSVCDDWYASHIVLLLS